MSTAPQRARRVLADMQGVYVHSLPRSLRHLSVGDALNDAKDLILFLQEMVNGMDAAEEPMGSRAYRGLARVLDLVLDKLEIGDGSYKFPTFSWEDKTPMLAERDGGTP